jgi:hypothetical protein
MPGILDQQTPRFSDNRSPKSSGGKDLNDLAVCWQSHF